MFVFVFYVCACNGFLDQRWKAFQIAMSFCKMGIIMIGLESDIILDTLLEAEVWEESQFTLILCSCKLNFVVHR